MAKVLYVDETGDDGIFIVGGLLIDEAYVERSYKRFKNSLKNIRLSTKLKQKVYIEFKAVVLDREYQKIKEKMLSSINDCDFSVLFSSYKILGRFDQKSKEKIYIELLNKVVSFIDDDIIIVFDTFNNAKFESKICRSIKCNANVLSIHSDDSRRVHGLQYIDNICSAYRKHITEDDSHFYTLISDRAFEV